MSISKISPSAINLFKKKKKKQPIVDENAVLPSVEVDNTVQPVTIPSVEDATKKEPVAATAPSDTPHVPRRRG